MKPARGLAWAQAGAFLLLTALAWGLFAPDRGFVQDEPWLLAALREHRAALWGFLWPGRRSLELTPLRPFAGVPYALAVHTPWPRLALQLTFGATWLATGLLAARYLRLLLPRQPLAAFTAGALVLSACGDHAVNNLAYLTSFQAAALLLAALMEVSSWVLAGRRHSLVLAVVLLGLSLLTYDGMLAAAVVAPLTLLVLPADRARTAETTRRTRLALVAWLGVALPYALAFVWFMSRPGNYGASMVARPAPAVLASRAWGLFALNFTPWRWPALFVRPEDGTAGLALSETLRLGLAVAGVGVVLAVGLWLARSARGEGPPPEAPARCGWLALALATTALLANAGVALVVDWAFRSQLASRLFVSLALTLACAKLGEALRRTALARAAPLAFLAALPFVLWGLQAGLASQDMYLTLWRRHRLELRSILSAAPSFGPGAQLLVYLPPGSPYTSLHYNGVGGPWLEYLYAPAPETVIWGQAGGPRCEAQATAFVCRNEALAECYASGRCQPRVLPFDHTVLLAYSRERGRFELQERLPPELVPAGGAGYAPRAWIQARPWSPWARELLETPELLGAFFPGPAAAP